MANVDETLDPQQVITSLMESIECLREEILQLRNNNRILRRVHSALRSANDSLRRQVELAHQNDELFKKFCNGDFDAKVKSSEGGGLPEPEPQVERLG